MCGERGQAPERKGAQGSGPDVDRLLDRIAELGPFFVLESGPRPVEGWQPMTAVIDDAAGALTSHVEEVRERLAERAGVPVQDVEWRVAASVTHQGLAARVLGPALALTIETGLALRCRPGGLVWRHDDAFPSRIRVGVGRPELVSDVEATVGFDREGLQAFADPLVEAVHRLGVSRRILRGNVASAVAGAAAMIDQAAESPRARQFVAALCAGGMLEGGYDGATFRRRSCCLIYRVGPTAAFCGDCVLTVPR